MKELPTRKKNRLREYDYSLEGSYFITICVKDRKELLCQIVGDAALGVPKVELTEEGKTVKERIDYIMTCPNIHIETYIIMPNHIHLLINITSGTPKAASPTKAMIPQIVNALKSLTTKRLGYSIWQRSYHDHVVRGEKEYNRIAEYIDYNPTTWEDDCFHPSKGRRYSV
jgi:REP element-mobilizing transposase RayT